MQKSLLFFAAFALSALAGYAQDAVASEPNDFSWIQCTAMPCAPSAVSSPVMRAADEESADPFWWSYRDPTPQTFGGWKSPETYCVGIYIPDDYVGYQVDSIRFALGASKGLENLRIWQHMGIPENFQDADIIEAVHKDPVNYHDNNEWNTAVFSEPVMIETPKNKYTKCCVGFAFDQTVSKDLQPLAFTESDPNFSCWILATKNFSSWGSFASLYGAYAMSVRLSKPQPDAISGLQHAPAAIESYYTLDGRRHATKQKGVNLVKYTDGSIRRVLAE